MTTDQRPRRHGAAVLLGFLTGGLTALPAFPLAVWMTFGLAAGWSGTDFSTGEPGPRDWGTVAGTSTILVLCIAVPLLVGWGVCRVADLVLSRRRERPPLR